MARVSDPDVLLVIDAARALLIAMDVTMSTRTYRTPREALREALAAVDKADEEEFAAYMNRAHPYSKTPPPCG